MSELFDAETPGYFSGRPENWEERKAPALPSPAAEEPHTQVHGVPGYYSARFSRKQFVRAEGAAVQPSWKLNLSKRWRRREGKKEEKEVKVEDQEEKGTLYRLSSHPRAPIDEQVSAQVSDVCIIDPSASCYDPVCAWKMAAAVAESLVDIAYSLGAVTDSSRQMMLRKLQSIQADLAETECRLINGAISGSVFLALISHSWMFRDTVEELEDAIDEYDYLSFEPNVSNPTFKFVKGKTINIVARFLSSTRNQRRLKSALRLLQDHLTKGYDFVLTRLSSGPHYVRYRGLIDPAGGVFGRDREIEQTVLWMIKDTDIHVSLYALVGIAGMGKTMLAHIVCQDPRVLANFDNVVWLPVYVDFNTEAISRMILESITNTSSIMGLMHDSLTYTLSHRKVLLILDDVWEDSSIEKWKKLRAPLEVCKKGSRVLLTTRMQSVVDMAAVAMGTQAECLKLDGLAEDDSLMLLKKQLPSWINSEDYNNFLLIGEQIVKKIGGCPLVTSLVASWLGSHMEIQHWTTLLQKGWQHIEQKDMVIASFRRSYDHLPTELQACFRYCSIFPKGHKFSRTEVARMWTASGVIPSSLKQEKIDVQNVGEEYFDVLTRKSFFCCMLETKPSNGDQKEYYVLHSLMHDLAEVVSQGECARVDNSDFHNVSYTTRHLSIANGSVLGAIRGNFQLLRTLIITNEFCLDQKTEFVLRDVLESSRHLRLLYLDVPSLFHAFQGIGRLTHLRYLFLFSCDESHLRKVFKLYHLQVFKLKYFTGKEADCSDIHNLHCLRCLHAPDNMSSKIHQVGSLITLQELSGFDVTNNDGQRLAALGNLRSICQLSLRNVQNILGCQEATGIKLKDKLHMKFLSLSWNKNLKEPVNQDEQIIDNLEPNKEIQQLHIHGYSGVKLPFWIENSSFIHLVSLELEYCTKWKNLPSLQELNSLKHLKLENLFHLEYIGTMPEQQLEIDESENAWLPPFLSTLRVRWCPKLKELPAIPYSLELLIIKHVNLAVLPRIHQIYTGYRDSASVKSQLAFLHIESCTHLTSLDEGLLDQQEQLQSLTTLVIRHCERLRDLPMRGFAELHRLNSLEIVACPVLRDIKTEGGTLPISLRNLELNPCGDIEVSILMSLQNLTILRRLTLFNCSNIEELPSVEVFGTLNNLNDVSVGRCKNLLSFGGLGAVTSLRVLSILCCDKLGLSQSPQDGCSFKLLKLRIDRHALLSVEPLRSLRHVKDLQIGDDCAMVSLHEEWLLQNATSLHSIEIGVAEALCSLPSEMEKLGSLESLHIERAPLIQSLPPLPVTLSKLAIWGCDPMFVKRYERDVGEDWSKIAHIASVDIKAYSEGTYYSDDQRQDFINSNRLIVSLS
ncbi:unnamed protein product [Urochloa decumbens]|uniref:NB-ARC domain-containing protein n=1 Tax=Urochloa decumbens TaxID=240449 RepID=A0ABC8VJB3_9POAL